MKKCIDLHTHTTASDGSMRPAGLVMHARNSGLFAVAVTDHDTVDGLAEAVAEGGRTGIEVLPGVEISADYERETHILGYFPDGEYTGIEEVLKQLKKNRDERNPKIIRKLNELGINISMEEATDEAAGSIIGRPHIAAAMLRKGYAASIQEAFDKYLAFGRPAYFKKEKLTPGESIRAISGAGGIPVLAHPLSMGFGAYKLEKLVGSLCACGLMGIECYYVDYDSEDRTNLLRIARTYDLLATGGSDFHGTFKPDIEIGTGRGDLRVPYECLDMLKKATIKK